MTTDASPLQCPKCKSRKVGNHLAWHRNEYSWANIMEAFFWIILIPLAVLMIIRRSVWPGPNEVICLDCKHAWLPDAAHRPTE